MNKYITLLTCAALSACASPSSEDAVPPAMLPVASSPTAAEQPPSDAVAATLPEVRYYVISDG